MGTNWREQRRAELSAARSGLELLRVVLLYRDAVGLDLYRQLPSSLSFTNMVDAILDREADLVERAKAS
jgi:hypothetical protein